MLAQITSHILMVRPANFAFNEETAANNAFQSRDGLMSVEEMRQNARNEFDEMVSRLRESGVEVHVVEDTPTPIKPDAVFPNNWVAFHHDGSISTYPMYAPTRRLERNETIVQQVLQSGFTSNGIRNHYETYEAEHRFLEGTGSIVFDHAHQLAYACLSPRTDPDLLERHCRDIGYEKVVFHAIDGTGKDIYHTNVMMAIGETFVVICLDSVQNEAERAHLIALFEKTNKEIIEITLEQMNEFAGNMLQVKGDEQPVLVMSERAFHALRPDQIERLKSHTALLYSPLKVIETYGGGSARCMMAEIFLPTTNG